MEAFTMNYRGYSIEPETDPWCLKYEGPIRYFRDERIFGASSIEEAKELIDEREAEEESRVRIFTQKAYDVNKMFV